MQKIARSTPAIIKVVLDPLQRFIATQASSGIVLLIAVVVALVWANSTWSESYFHTWETIGSIRVGSFVFEKNLHFWINDGLMAIFFFVVGLEIKRELLTGELATPKKAALPAIAALGGMIVPGLIYAYFNWGGPAAAGWGTPMATDIAFALGVVTLLGRKVPVGLKVFLVALAIVDDMGAVILIAVFYTAKLSILHLVAALACYVFLWAMNLAGFRYILLYIVLGILMWYLMYLSGVHPTIAGVLLATTIPARPRMDIDEFVEENRQLLKEISDTKGQSDNESEEHRQESILFIEKNCEKAQTPLLRMENRLHIWVSFFIMPLFALANAGVLIDTEQISELDGPLSLGIILGLMVGKPVGITLFTWLSLKLRLAALPSHSRWVQVFGIGLLGGIGFTMSIFIANLAFGVGDMLELGKIAILTGSLLSSLLGVTVLLAFGRKPA